jgi:hypothetical protein
MIMATCLGSFKGSISDVTLSSSSYAQGGHEFKVQSSGFKFAVQGLLKSKLNAPKSPFLKVAEKCSDTRPDGPASEAYK